MSADRSEIEIKIEDIDEKFKIVRISGKLDESNADETFKEVMGLYAKIPEGLKIIFDFDDLTYMNSKSIGYLTDLFAKLTETGGNMGFVNLRPNIIDVLDVVGLTQLVKVFDNIEEAKSSL